jgi:hypothetical protein
MEEGCPVRAEDVERLSPYATPHLKRFGKYPEDFGTGEPRPPTSLPIRDTDLITKSTNLVAISAGAALL